MLIRQAITVGLVLGMAVVAGCSTTYVVLRDVPQNPSFAVIPANSTLAEVQFANRVAGDILSCGVSVHAPPAPVFVTDESSIEAGMTATDPATAARIAGDTKHVESYIAYDDLNATYTAHTFRGAGQVRIQLRETREVVAVVNSWRTGGTPGENPWMWEEGRPQACGLINALRGVGSEGESL